MMPPSDASDRVVIWHVQVPKVLFSPLEHAARPATVARRVTGVIWHGAGIPKVRKSGGTRTDMIFYGRNLSVLP